MTIWVILLWRSCIKRKIATINERGAWTYLVQPSQVPSFQNSFHGRAKEILTICVVILISMLKFTKYNNAPLSVIKIVKYYKVGRGGHWGGWHQNATKILAPSSSLSIKWLSIVTSGEGGSAKILPKIMAPPLSVIKIVQYCGVVGGGAPKSFKNNGALPLCH